MGCFEPFPVLAERLNPGFDQAGGQQRALCQVGSFAGQHHLWAVLVILLCAVTQVVVSWSGKRDLAKEQLVWTDLTGHSPGDLRKVVIGLLVSLAWFVLLSWGVYRETLSPFTAATLGAVWTLGLFWVGMGKSTGTERGLGFLVNKVRDDRF